jgi:hypothetical protein
LKVSSTGDEGNPQQRLDAVIGQGGPTVTLRATHGHIELRRK